AVVKDIVDAPIDLERLIDLIGGAEVEDRIAGQFGELVGLVAVEILAGDVQSIAADLEGVGDRIIDACLDAVPGNRRNLVTGQDLDIAIGVGKGTIRGKLQCVKEARVEKSVARTQLIFVRLEGDLGLDALTPRRTDILEEAETLQDWTWEGENVVRILCAERAHLPG